MLTGKIKHFERSKGWGFIETEDGDDYFFNVANVRAGQNIRLGDIVKFDYRESQRGPSAINILKLRS
tara:strand:- start:535 stop:735 length:201 start_codon:yes stop_codon:yes gene_type:complete